MADEYGRYGNQDVEPWRRIPTAGEPKMEAEPPLWKRITTSIMRDPQNAIPSPMPMGLVMKGPNAAINAAKVAAEAKTFLPADAKPGVESGIAYMKAKYPKLADLVEGRIFGVNNLDQMPGPPRSGTVLGVYGEQPAGMSIGVNDKLGEYSSVGTTGHELTHAIQDARSQQVPLISKADRPTLSGPGVPRTPETGPFRIDAATGETPYQAQSDLVGYKKNPYETQANWGKTTAQDTYDRFMKNLGIDPYKQSNSFTK